VISLYKVVGTVEAYVLAEREEDACERMKSVSLGEHRGAVGAKLTETIKVTEDDLSPGASKSKPVLARFTPLPETRAGWTCAQWANATRSDCIREAEGLRKEATRIEEHAARLRAQIAMLEALAQPKAPAVSEAKPEPRPSIDEVAFSLQMYWSAQYPNGYTRNDGETIFYYPGDERGPNVAEYLGYPVTVKTGAPPVLAREPLHPDMFGGTDYPEVKL
jgi:hypothetical protein